MFDLFGHDYLTGPETSQIFYSDRRPVIAPICSDLSNEQNVSQHFGRMACSIPYDDKSLSFTRSNFKALSLRIISIPCLVTIIPFLLDMLSNSVNELQQPWTRESYYWTCPTHEDLLVTILSPDGDTN
mmetsp:Transcript_5095/g.9033  ORF Transcript_5095/g.9033 Transcript_5095/m.9033 type:complete len:128 (+) Transcript_5095:205-588(+)